MAACVGQGGILASLVRASCRRACRKSPYISSTATPTSRSASSSPRGPRKSTVGAMLRDCGAALIDADQIARSVSAVGGAAIPIIRAQFGDAFIDADGAMDRAKMRELVFKDATKKHLLETIVHPLVSQNTWDAADAARQSGSPVVVFDVPLLVESRLWPTQLDAVIVVDCRPETQISRVQQRSGLAPEVIKSIIASQASRSARRAVAA